MRHLSILLVAATLAGCGSPAPEPADSAASTESAAPEAVPAATAATAANAEGATAFAQCRACHSDQAGQDGAGPALFGVVGRRAGSIEGFSYSSAMRASGIVWDRTTLDRYLAGPQTVVSGSRMAYAVPDPAQRAAIIDYLETLR